MKKTSYILLAVCALAASCTKTDEPATAPRKTEQVSIGATITSGYTSAEGTRVSLDASTGKAAWQNGDRIGIKVASDNTAQTDVLSTEDCLTFCGTIASPAYDSGDRIYAAYPASAISAKSAVFTVETEQDGALPSPMMVATHEVTGGSSAADISLKFRQAGALLMLTTDTKMDRIAVSAIGSEDVAGTYTFDFTNGTTSCSGSKSIAITPASTTVFIHMPAVSFSKGLCLTLTSGSQTMIQSYSSITALEAGKAYSLGSLVFKPATVTLGDVSTSYTKNGTVSKTNDIGGSEMRFGECSFSGISNAMVAQTGIEYNGTQAAAERNGKTFAPATLTGLDWTSYKVRAYVKTVDDQMFYSPEKSAVVTGIPYTAAPPKNDKWVTSDNANNIHFRDSYVQLGMDGTSTGDPQITLTLNIPENIDITLDVSVNVNANRVGIWYNPTFTLSAGGTTVFTQKSNNDSKQYNVSKNATLTSSNGTIQCKTGVRTRLGGQARVHSVSVKYR